MTTINEEENELFASTKNAGKLQEKKDFTFDAVGCEIDSLDGVHKYMCKEIGEDKLNKIYPILRDFGDRILSEDNSEHLIKALSPYLTRNEVRKYYMPLC